MKSLLRNELRAGRRGLSSSEHRRRSRRAAAAVLRTPEFKSGARVAIYLPIDRETATADLVAAARRRKIRLYVPVVVDRRHRRLRFHPFAVGTRRGAFGIREPRRRAAPVAPRWFELVVVPLVGVDRDGRRLGFGGGFYDRAFAFRRLRTCWRGPRLIGLAFDCQRTDAVHADIWDLKLDALATESGISYFFGVRP